MVNSESEEMPIGPSQNFDEGGLSKRAGFVPTFKILTGKYPRPSPTGERVEGRSVMRSSKAPTRRPSPVRVRFGAHRDRARSTSVGGADWRFSNLACSRAHEQGGGSCMRDRDTDGEALDAWEERRADHTALRWRWLELDWDEGPILQTELSGRPRRGTRGIGGRPAHAGIARTRRREDVRAYIRADTAP